MGPSPAEFSTPVEFPAAAWRRDCRWPLGSLIGPGRYWLGGMRLLGRDSAACVQGTHTFGSDSIQCCPPAMHGFGVGQRSRHLQPLRSSSHRGTVRMARSRPGRRTTELITLLACRGVKRNTLCNVSSVAVVIASSVSQAVKLPRWRRAASCSVQFVVQRRCRGTWYQPSARGDEQRGRAPDATKMEDCHLLPNLAAASINHPIRTTRHR
jgi:hypothetical protein